MLTTILTPFDHELIVPLTDEAGEPVALSDLADAYVAIFVNGELKTRFQELGDEDVFGWEPVDDNPNAILCRLTTADTNGWRGLVTMEVTLVELNEDFPNGLKRHKTQKSALWQAEKSMGGLTPL